MRRLPLPGDVVVMEGDFVSHDSVVARASIPGSIHIVNVYHDLRVDPDEINKYMLKKVGDEVEEGETLARFTAFFGLLKEVCNSPISGTLELCSTVTGQAMIREKPVPLDLRAYIPGRVEKILPHEGVVIATPATFIQGIFGVGGESAGEILMLADSPHEVVNSSQIGPESKGKVLVCGSLISSEALNKAIKLGVRGLVVGGIKGKTLRSLMGKELGVVITGQEYLGITLIVTEGFGEMSMQKKTFELLKEKEGKLACVNGATQIRAGVVRPEIIVPLEGIYHNEPFKDTMETEHEGLQPATKIRIIREPYFGLLGEVISLPIPLYQLESESKVRVLEAELENGRRVTIPRANVEIIEE